MTFQVGDRVVSKRRFPETLEGQLAPLGIGVQTVRAVKEARPEGQWVTTDFEPEWVDADWFSLVEPTLPSEDAGLQSPTPQEVVTQLGLQATASPEMLAQLRRLQQLAEREWLEHLPQAGETLAQAGRRYDAEVQGLLQAQETAGLLQVPMGANSGWYVRLGEKEDQVVFLWVFGTVHASGYVVSIARHEVARIQLPQPAMIQEEDDVS